MIAQLGRMGGKLAWGDVAGVTALEDGAAIFAHGRVPITRGARHWKIKESSLPPKRQRAITVGGRSSAPIVSRLQTEFCRAVVDGFDTWVTFTLMIDGALAARADDNEADFIRARSLAAIRKRTKRLGATHYLFWSMERERNRGIHLHAMAHATPENHTLMRGLIREGFETGCETALRAPALKFHTPIHRVAGPAEAGGWLRYCISNLVAPGVEVEGVRGKVGCIPLRVKPAGISRARGNE
jgi:hypothetical protein